MTIPIDLTVIHAYVIPGTSDERAFVTYHRRFTAHERVTIHFHDYTRDGYRMACEGYGCYTLVPARKP